MYRYSLTGFDTLGVLQSRIGEIDCDEATASCVRTVSLVDRPVGVTVASGIAGALSYMIAPPSYLVPSFRRFGISRFSTLGTLQSCTGQVNGDSGALDAYRGSLVAADRPASITGPGGYIAGRSYAVPDVSGGISVEFEEVYDI
jgi:hypothetical protein